MNRCKAVDDEHPLVIALRVARSQAWDGRRQARIVRSLIKGGATIPTEVVDGESVATLVYFFDVWLSKGERDQRG
jgi:hypothetical protein